MKMNTKFIIKKSFLAAANNLIKFTREYSSISVDIIISWSVNVGIVIFLFSHPLSVLST